jgi:chemotaxis signal transduction protein
VTLSAVVFPVGEDQYAVPAISVREVVSEPHSTRLPNVPAALVGAFNLRGDVVPMFDVAALLGIGALAEAPFAVVVATAAGPAALIVGGLPKVEVLGEQVTPSELRGALGVYDVDGGIAVLIDVEALLMSYTNVNASAVAEGLVGR